MHVTVTMDSTIALSHSNPVMLHAAGVMSCQLLGWPPVIYVGQSSTHRCQQMFL